MAYIRLEPQSIFNKAIVKVSAKGKATYDFDKLIVCSMEAHSLNEDDALDWVDYNICGLPSDQLTIRYND